MSKHRAFYILWLLWDLSFWTFTRLLILDSSWQGEDGIENSNILVDVIPGQSLSNLVNIMRCRHFQWIYLDCEAKENLAYASERFVKVCILIIFKSYFQIWMNYHNSAFLHSLRLTHFGRPVKLTNWHCQPHKSVWYQKVVQREERETTASYSQRIHTSIATLGTKQFCFDRLRRKIKILFLSANLWEHHQSCVTNMGPWGFCVNFISE